LARQDFFSNGGREGGIITFLFYVFYKHELFVISPLKSGFEEACFKYFAVFCVFANTLKFFAFENVEKRREKIAGKK
jgi:hypothetical protein